MRAEKGFVKINEVDIGLSKTVINALQYGPIKVAACEGKRRQSQLLFRLPMHYLVSSFCLYLWSAEVLRWWLWVSAVKLVASFVLCFTLNLLAPARKPAVPSWNRAGWNREHWALGYSPASDIHTWIRKKFAVNRRVSDFNTVYIPLQIQLHTFLWEDHNSLWKCREMVSSVNSTRRSTAKIKKPNPK